MGGASVDRDPGRYRAGVGIVLTDGAGHVWLGQRSGTHPGWQLPQGGIEPGEAIEAALWRELMEEVGTADARLLGATATWTYYEFPADSIDRRNWDGQRHIWFALRFLGDDAQLDPRVLPDPEFDGWRWATPAEAVAAVVPFKRDVYRTVFQRLGPLLG